MLQSVFEPHPAPMSALRAARRRPHGTRAVILDAARDLFRERSWGAVSMEAIADRSGFSRRTVYNQFLDCSELYRSTREALIREITQQLPVEIDGTADAAAALLSYCEQVAAALNSPAHMELFGSLVRDGWANQWLLEDYRRWIQGPIVRTLENYLHALKDRYQLTSLDVRREGQQLIADLEGLVVAPQMAPGIMSPSHARSSSVQDIVDTFAAKWLGESEAEQLR